VAVAFGVLAVSGAAWLQGASIDTALLLFSVPISIWVTFILLINEVPDMEADGACGKNTLPVRFGRAFTANLYLSGNIAAVAVVALLAGQGYLPLLAPLAPALLLVPAWRASAGIRVGVENRESMTQAIESTLAIHTVGSLWLTGCALFNLWW
jgi:1,4-dihydroxy-2-naphthoate octaprenyltransferase